MDKSERETHDFMNVDSFSQLPFIRPAPPPKEKAIRLFGIEFSDGPLNATNESESTTNNNDFELDGNNKDNNNIENNESSRRFECHYCCRNFPTSQALGGHQNAHKRERQHAKRAHLQSSTVHSSPFDAQAYGFMNYRFGGSATTSTTMAYPAWNGNSSTSGAMITSGGRFYGSIGHGNSYSHHHQQPINGSPLALWRVPATTTGAVQSNPILNRERSLQPLPLFAGEEMKMGVSRVSASGSQNRYLYDSKPSVNDHVSLDLHL